MLFQPLQLLPTFSLNMPMHANGVAVNSLPHAVISLPIIEKIKQTVEIKQSTIDIEEKGIRLRLTVVDTPGFGDAVNSDKR